MSLNLNLFLVIVLKVMLYDSIIKKYKKVINQNSIN